MKQTFGNVRPKVCALCQKTAGKSCLLADNVLRGKRHVDACVIANTVVAFGGEDGRILAAIGKNTYEG